MTAHTESITWDGLSATALAKRCDIAHVELLTETSSTQDVAHELAEKGAAAGTTVLADRQLAGRGRQGRSWTSEAGLGVWCTVIERPRNVGVVDVLSLRIGLNAAEGLDVFASDRIGVKWPNDLLLPDGKVGGILVEARWAGAALAWVAIGVGVNVVAPTLSAEGPAATGLRPGVQRADVFLALVRAVRAAAAAAGPFSDAELGRFQARDVLRGRRIVDPANGVAAGITADGALIVETPLGPEHVRSGTIRLAEDT
jgi:BirA family transcriptional regulator, biotin operon repressor / biotin---[acetyl-CoA-carboxylase] ligase